VRPYNIIDDFGPDALRYFVMREMVFGQDQNYSDESLIARYNADLANDLGNTLSRAIKMSAQRFDGQTPPVSCDSNVIRDAVLDFVPQYLAEMEQFAFSRALDVVWRLLTFINSYIVGTQPWTFIEPIRPAAIPKKQYVAEHLTTYESVSRQLWNILEGCRIVWVMVAPFMPHSTPEALARLGATNDVSRAALEWGALPNGVPVRVADPIFPRIDAAAYIGGNATMSNPPIETTQAAPPDLAKISIDKFFETDLRVAEIRAAERVEKSKKLIKLTVFDGTSDRTLVAGIATKYTPEELVGRKVVIVANLQPAKLMGVESNGMVLAASIDGEPSLLSVDPSVPAGTKVK
jgi:methionyl-tRNA synthetase